MVWSLVAGVVVVLVVGGYVVGFNRLRKQDVAVEEALGGVDVQLTRRAELIPNLVATVEGYAAHERGVLEEVTAARTRVQDAARGGSVEDKAAADAALQQALVDVVAVAEGYPELRASTSFLQLQDQLADTENQLASARQHYNDAVVRLNTTSSTIPWMFFAGAAGVSKREFYEAPDAQQAPPTVQF